MFIIVNFPHNGDHCYDFTTPRNKVIKRQFYSEIARRTT